MKIYKTQAKLIVILCILKIFDLIKYNDRALCANARNRLVKFAARKAHIIYYAIKIAYNFWHASFFGSCCHSYRKLDFRIMCCNAEILRHV